MHDYLFWIAAFIVVVIVLIAVFYRKKTVLPAVLTAEQAPATIDQDFLKPEILNVIVEEWKQTISTQMHFNDLIIRFRTIVLTAFSTIVGALAVIVKTVAKPEVLNFSGVYYVVLSLWCVAFFIDAFYYHRLLIGSVNHALKFDENKSLKSVGLFGLTSSITERVSPEWSLNLIFIFYGVPAIVALLVLVFF